MILIFLIFMTDTYILRVNNLKQPGRSSPVQDFPHDSSWSPHLPILQDLWQRRGRLQWHTVPSEPSLPPCSVSCSGQYRYCWPVSAFHTCPAGCSRHPFFCSCLSLQRIGNSGIVNDIDEVADQLLGFRYKVAEFVQTEQLV